MQDCVISQLLWLKNQNLIFAWFVYMHTTLSEWLSTLDLYILNGRKMLVILRAADGTASPLRTQHLVIGLPQRSSPSTS